MADVRFNPLLSLVDIAKKEVGVREEEGKNNIGTEIQIYQSATWLAPGSWPWCAAFMCWVLREWLKDPMSQKALKLKTAKEVEDWRCKDAKAFGWEACKIG